MEIIKFTDTILGFFRSAFTRTSTYQWFIVAVIGFIMINDSNGVTSMVRELSLAPKHYENLLHFFRSNAWKTEKLVEAWVVAVKSNAPILQVKERNILIGDGVKQSKEARKMPAVKKLHQESENSSKSQYIFGHLFGVVAVLIGNRQKQFALPLSSSIQDGIKELHKYTDSCYEVESHVVQVIAQAGRVAQQLGASVLLLDRYFLSVPVLKKAMSFLSEDGKQLLEIVVKAKMASKAYTDPPPYCGKGRPRKKGDPVKLKELFVTAADKFICTDLYLYGQAQKVQYYYVDLLWGTKLYQKLRFVLVKSETFPPSIFATTLLTLSPIEIIELYSYRHKIEISFKTLKHTLFGFGYHFWSMYMPRLDRFHKENNSSALEAITDKLSQQKITQTLKAIEGFVMCSCIACGILQMISLRFSNSHNLANSRFLRTITNSIVSEDTVADYFRKKFFRLIVQAPNIDFLKIINSKMLSLTLDLCKSS